MLLTLHLQSPERHLPDTIWRKLLKWATTPHPTLHLVKQPALSSVATVLDNQGLSKMLPGPCPCRTALD